MDKMGLRLTQRREITAHILQRAGSITRSWIELLICIVFRADRTQEKRPHECRRTLRLATPVGVYLCSSLTSSCISIRLWSFEPRGGWRSRGDEASPRSALNVGLSSSEHTQSQTLPHLTPIIRTGFSDSGLTCHYSVTHYLICN